MALAEWTLSRYKGGIVKLWHNTCVRHWTHRPEDPEPLRRWRRRVKATHACEPLAPLIDDTR